MHLGNWCPWMNSWKNNEKCQTIAMFVSGFKEFVKCHILHAFLSLTCANGTCCFVSRTCAEPPPVTLSAWPMLAPCATPRGAAPWSKTTAYLQPLPLLMSLVSPTNTNLHSVYIVTVVCSVMWVHINGLKCPRIYEHPDITFPLDRTRVQHATRQREGLRGRVWETAGQPHDVSHPHPDKPHQPLVSLQRSHHHWIPGQWARWVFCDPWPLCLTANRIVERLKRCEAKVRSDTNCY